MRRTKSPRQAVERVTSAFPDVGRPELPKRPVQELAFILDLLKRRHADRNLVHEQVRWYGRIPTRGLSGWEEEALEWGRTEVAS